MIFCYNSEATLQGTVAVGFCDEGYKRVGTEMVTCGPNGGWDELPRCLQEPVTLSSKNLVKVDNVSDLMTYTSYFACVGSLLPWNWVMVAIGVVIWLIAATLDVVGLVVLIILAREKCMLPIKLTMI